MSLLAPSDQQFLKDAFLKLQRPVRLLFFTQTIGCETCEEAARILRELPPLGDRVTVEEVNLVLERDRAAGFGIDRAPAIAVLAGDDPEDTRIRFLGAPTGYDFMALVDAILAAGGASARHLSEASLTRVAALTTPTAIKVFVTPT